MTDWEIEFYRDARGHSPITEFLDALEKTERARCARALALLREFGPLLGMPHARPVEGFWELRAGANRMFYFALVGRRFVILHAYRKKSQKTPRREIETARRRLTDYRERER